MELIYDDKTGTWGEAPEAYETIECATKEDYEYAKKAIKGYKELEAKHWDECRQIAHYEDELKEAKRLLKSAISEWLIVCEWGDCGEYCGWYENGQCTQEWSRKAEALALIGEEGENDEKDNTDNP